MKVLILRIWSLLLTFTLICGWFQVVVDADEKKISDTIPSLTAPIRRVLVPANQPDSWLTKDWQPVKNQDFKEFLIWRKNQQPGPQNVQIQNVKYTAILAGSTLQAGTFTAEIENSQSGAELISLGQMNLAVSNLSWKGKTEKVIWGETSTGKTMLLVPPGKQTLSGKWSFSGKRKTRNIQFDFHLIPSAISQLNIMLPVGHRLMTTVGEVVGPHPSKIAGMRLWHIEPGSESSCQLTIQQTDQVSIPSSLVLMKHHLSYVARRDEMSFQADLNPQVYHHPVKKLYVTIANRLTIHTVTYGGEFPLNWKIINKKKKQRQLEITLSDPLLGTGRSIHIEGTVPFLESSEQTLPTFQYPGAFFLDGTVRLQIDPPLQLRSLRQQGYLQTGAVFDATLGETSTFRQYKSTAHMIVHITPPLLEMHARLVSHLTVSSEKSELQSWLDINIRKGNTYSLECTLPKNWNLIDVVSQPIQGSPAIAISDWSVVLRKDGGQSLRIQFRDAIASGTNHRILISARNTHHDVVSPLRIPLTIPQGISSLDEWIVVEHSSQLKSRWDKLENFQVVKSIPKEFSPFDHIHNSQSTNQIIIEREGASASAILSFQRKKPGQISSAKKKIPSTTSDQSQAQTSPILVWGKLHSRPAITSGAKDLHEMKYTLPASKTPLIFQFRLPASATIQKVSVNGQPVEVPSNGRPLVTISALPQNQINAISVRYTVASNRSWFSDQHEIPLPGINHQLTQLHWNVTLPENFSLYSDSNDMPFHFDSAQQRLSWMTRFLGPIGRKATSALFNPFSVNAWKSLITNPPPAPLEIRHSNQLNHSSQGRAAGWIVHRAESYHPPTSLKISIHNQQSIHAFAWLCFWGSLLAGIILRKTGWRFRAGLGTFWVVGNIILAYLITSLWGEIFGANISGTLLALLIPLRFMKSSEQVANSEIPMGSTVSFINPPAFLLMILFLFLAIQSFAQEKSPVIPLPKSAENQHVSAVSVMIPVDQKQQPSDQFSVVYLNQPLMKEFQFYLQEKELKPRYLLSEARYVGKIENWKDITLAAHYDVTLLKHADSSQEMSIYLPISNANLGGETACLVDGKPHPILRSKDVGYLIKLTGSTNRTSQQKKENANSVHHITLQLHPHLTSTQEGTELQMQIPPVVSSHIQLALSKEVSHAALLHSAGSLTAETNGTSMKADFGKSKLLHIQWQYQNGERTAPIVQSKVEISPTTVVDLHHGWLHLRSSLKIKVTEGKVNRLQFQLPAHAVLSAVNTNLKQEFSTQTINNKETTLSIDFAEEQTNEIQLELVYELPLPFSATSIKIPKLRTISGSQQTRQINSILKPHLLAVTAPKEFDVSVLKTQSTDVTSVSIESFQNHTTEFSTTRNLAFAFSIEKPTALSFQLKPKSSVSTVFTHQKVIIDAEKMNWTFNAELETKDVPAYRHQIQMDPRMKILSVSVKEDEAERLVRWSRKDKNVLLVLNGQTLGTQDIVIQGTMRIPQSGFLNIPIVSLKGATVLEANFDLYHSAATSLTLLDQQLAFKKEPAQSNQPTLQNDEVISFGKLKLNPTTKRIRLRLSPLNRTKNKMTLLTKVQPLKDQLVQLDTFVLVPRASINKNRLQLQIPERWGDDYVVESKDCKISKGKNQIISCHLLPKRQNRVLLIHLHKKLSVSVLDQPLSVVKPLSRFVVQNLLLIPRGHLWGQNNEDSKMIDLNSLNASLSQVLNLNRAEIAWQLFEKTTTTPWETSTNHKSDNIEFISCHTKINFQQHDRISGQTEILLIAEKPTTIKLISPQSIQPQGVIINGFATKYKLLTETEQISDLFTFKIPVKADVNHVFIVWRVPMNESIAGQTVPFPLLPQFPSQQQTLSLSSSSVLFAEINSNPSSKITLLERDTWKLVQLMKAIQEKKQTTKQMNSLTSLLIHFYDLFQLRYQEIITSGLNKEAAGQLAEIRKIVELQRESSTSSFLTENLLLNSEVDDVRGDLELSTNIQVYKLTPQEVKSYPVVIAKSQNHFVVGLLVVLIFLVSFPVAHWLFRLELYQWFSRYPAIAWGLGALFWWTFLAASFGGFSLAILVIVVTTWFSFRHKNRSTPTTETQ